jgi:hypothetical protein
MFVTIHLETSNFVSTIAPKKLLTAEEFFLLPDSDGSHQELVRGEIVTMPRSLTQ